MWILQMYEPGRAPHYWKPHSVKEKCAMKSYAIGVLKWLTKLKTTCFSVECGYVLMTVPYISVLSAFCNDTLDIRSQFCISDYPVIQ